MVFNRLSRLQLKNRTKTESSPQQSTKVDHSIYLEDGGTKTPYLGSLNLIFCPELGVSSENLTRIDTRMLLSYEKLISLLLVVGAIKRVLTEGTSQLNVVFRKGTA